MGFFQKEEICTTNQLVELFATKDEPYYLTKKQAVAYLVYLLTQHGGKIKQGEMEVYGTGVIEYAEQNFLFRLSDTVLYAALAFLEGKENKKHFKLIITRKVNVPGRGRPRHNKKWDIKTHPDMMNMASPALRYWTTFAPRFVVKKK